MTTIDSNSSNTITLSGVLDSTEPNDTQTMLDFGSGSVSNSANGITSITVNNTNNGYTYGSSLASPGNGYSSVSTATYSSGVVTNIPSGSTITLSNSSYTPPPLNSGMTMTGTMTCPDVIIDGISMKETMQKIADRLAILLPDLEKLEKFAALKETYEHYKLLEALIGKDNGDNKI